MAADPHYYIDIDGLIRWLCAEPRTAGSARNAAIADGLLARYRAAGYHAEFESFDFTGWELTDPPAIEYVAPERRAMAGCLPVVWSGSTNGPVTGRVLRPGSAGMPKAILTFEAYPWDLFPVVDDGGAVVACLLGGEVVWPQTRDDESDPTPYVMIPPSEWRFIRRKLARGEEVVVRLSVGSRYLPGRTLRNVIARRADGDTRRRPTVIVCAHYDSFFCTRGAHDNASGTAALLCLARRVGPRDGVTFVSFDAEEWNKLGSYRHVETLARDGRLADVRAVINLDSVGVGAGLYVLASPDHAGSVVRALDDGNDEDLPDRPLQLLSDPSFRQFDTWPFMRRGVPAVQVGTFGAQLFSHWHQPGDVPELIGPQGCELIGDVVSVVEALLERWAPERVTG